MFDYELYNAVEQNNFNLVQELLKTNYYCDINHLYHYFGVTLLHRAVQKNNVEIVKLLLENGANVNAQTKTQDTSLHLACLYYYQHPKYDLIDILIQFGADMNIKSKYGENVFEVLRRYNHNNVIQFIKFRLICFELWNLWKLN